MLRQVTPGLGYEGVIYMNQAKENGHGGLDLGMPGVSISEKNQDN